MEIQIIKILNNKNFMNKNNKNYYKLSGYTKRLWLSKKINIIDNGRVIYNLISSNGLSVEGKVYGTGTDKNGFYIIFCMEPFELNNGLDLKKLFTGDSDEVWDRQILSGKAILTEVFNPTKDMEFKVLIDEKKMKKYYFQNSKMKSVLKDDILILDFRLGELGDQAFHIELSGIEPGWVVCENNNELDEYSEKIIRNVYFRKYGVEKYIIYIDSSCIEETATQMTPSTISIETIGYENQYIVKCKNIYIKRYNYFIDKVITSKGMKCIDLNECKDINYKKILREKWIKAFIKGIDIEFVYYENMYSNEFLYDVSSAFSGIRGEEAKECLYKMNSSNLYIVCYDVGTKNICYKLENANDFDCEMIECYEDIYVTDEDFTWTYIRTHEDEIGYGPFFIEGKRNHYIK